MNRSSARAIERHRLACIPLEGGDWLVGKLAAGFYADERLGVLDGELEANPVTHRVHVGTTLDSAVEDWCAARNLPYERED